MTIQIERDIGSVVMDDVTWEYYTQTLEALGPSRGKRITYDEGRMEIVTTSDAHERTKSMIARLIELYALEADVPIVPVGSLTLRQQLIKKGLEPDECYFVQTDAPAMSEGEYDLTIRPVPNLALEVEISKGSIPKQPIYAKFGVREVWRYDRTQVIPLELGDDGRYHPRDSSIVFPKLSMSDFNRFLRQALTGSQHEAMKAFRDWLRSQPH